MNLGISSVQVDSINDVLPSLPAAPSYLSGSSRFNAESLSDPWLSGSQLKWIGPFTVDSGGVATLAFDVAFPVIEGSYTNLAFGAIGDTRIDSTIDVTDYAPATAVIIVGMPDIVILKSTQTISDPVNGNINPKAVPGSRLLYTVTITNQGVGMADDHSVIAGDMIPPGSSLYVGDLSGIGSGPVTFTDGSPSSGLVYTFDSLSSSSDNLAFSRDGGLTYDYYPVPDSNGLDLNVTNILINPQGFFWGADGMSYPNCSFRFMVQLR